MLSRAQMRAASQTFKLIFWATLQSKGVQTPKVQDALQLLMEIPESDWKGLYRWFKGLPIMRHWIGDRQAQRLEAEGFEVIHKPWESTLTVLRDDVKYDKLGGYKPAIMMLANEVLLLKYRELIRLLRDMRAGTVYGNCFDGYPLISASHATGTNLGTAALTGAALDAAILAMRQQVDPTVGDSLLIEPTHLWYDEALQGTVENILDIDLVSDGETAATTIRNKHFKKLQPLPLPLGSGYTAWWGLYAANQGGMLGPVLWQYDPAGGDFVAMDKEDDEPNFMRRELLYGTEMWGAIAPGFPQYIWASDGTT